MPQAESPHAFPDCREFMDLAHESSKGWQVFFQEKGQAMNFRLRCYTARDRDRLRNSKIYPKDDPMYRKSTWDKLTFQIREVHREGKIVWAMAAMHGEGSLEIIGLGHGEVP